MKRVYFVVMGLLLSLALMPNNGWAADWYSRDKAVFYQDGGCDGGKYVELEEGEYADLTKLRVSGSGSATWNDRISCMLIGSGISKVIVYEHINFGGRSSEFTRSGRSDSIQNIKGGWWDDKISSIKVIGTDSSSPWGKPVPRDKAVFYQDGGCDGGRSVELKEGEYPNLLKLRVSGSGSATWNDRISCMAIGSDITKVIVYEHVNFGGRSSVFTRSGRSDSIQDIEGGWWDDKISSIKVIGTDSSSPWGKPVPRDKAVFYQDGGCDGGRSVELKEGEYPNLLKIRVSGSGGATWNDRISCMAIGSDITKVIVYEHVNFGGRSSVFTRSGRSDSIQDIEGGWWDDKISSIKVIGTDSSSPWGETIPRDKAVFYQDGGCDGGRSVELKEGEYPNLTDLRVSGSGGGTWNDRISCMAIGSDITQVIVYEYVNFSGRSSVFTRSGRPDSIQNIEGGWWDDKISSIKVIGTGSPPPWGETIPHDKAVFYQDGGCDDGRSVELEEGEYPNLTELRVSGSGGATWNDRISCMAIGSDITRVIVYEHVNFGGRSSVFTRSGRSDSIQNIMGGWWDDKISSIKIQ